MSSYESIQRANKILFHYRKNARNRRKLRAIFYVTSSTIFDALFFFEKRLTRYKIYGQKVNKHTPHGSFESALGPKEPVSVSCGVLSGGTREKNGLFFEFRCVDEEEASKRSKKRGIAPGFGCETRFGLIKFSFIFGPIRSWSVFEDSD